MTESDRTYREITLPAGTFRMYDDDPFIWVQMTGESLVDRIMNSFNNGEIKKK